MHFLAACLLVAGGCMTQQSHYGISGLATAPSPVIAAPPGALSEADNCVIRRAGMIEPRPGFGAESGQAADTLTSIWKILPYADSYLRVGYTGSLIKSVWKDGTAVSALQGLWDPYTIRGVEARKNLYLTTSDATRKLTAALDTTAAYAGLQQPVYVSTTLTAGTGILSNNNSSAYRFVIRRTDANNLIVRSAPSSRVITDNTAGGARDVVLTFVFGLARGWAVGDVIEVYRSFQVTTASVEPSDELFYVHEITLAAADVNTNGYATYTDNIAEADLGQALYTNATQDGISRENFPPPLAHDLALFQGSLFASNITWPHAMTIRWPFAGDKSTVATGVGFRTYTGTRTNGSNQITGLSSTVGLKIGQILSVGTSWGGTAPVRITNIVGATLTMSETWGGATDGAPVSLTFYDSIRIKTASEDQYYVSLGGIVLGDGSTVLREFKSAYTNVRVTNDGWRFVSGVPSTATPLLLQLQQILPSTGSFQVWATHGSEYDPVLPEPTVATGQTSTQDSFPNGLTWSKQDEPEHFIRRNLWLVGNAKAPIVRIVPLLDGLLIFKGKGDGIYMLTGYGELSGWSVREIDPTTYLLHPELVTKLEDSAYAWTNTGMCRVDSGGQTMLSAPILDLTESIENTLNPNSATMAFANAVGNLPDHEVIFSLPTSTTDKHAPLYTYVFNTLTQAWTSWFGDTGLPPNAMALDPSRNLLLLGPSNDGIVRYARTSTNELYPATDLQYSVTVSAVSGTSVTISAGSGWTPAVGDLLKQGSVYATVTAFSDATHFTVSEAVSAGAATAGVGYTSRIAWLPRLEPTGAQVKRYQSIVLHWDDIFGVYNWTEVFGGTRGNSAFLNYTRTKVRTHSRAETRALLPASVALDSQLYVTFVIANAAAQWRLTGLTQNFGIATDRVSL